MVASSGALGAATPIARTLMVDVRDLAENRAVGAEIELTIGGMRAGVVSVGSIGNEPVVIELSDARATIELAVSLLGQRQFMTVEPGQDLVSFVFPLTLHFAVGVPGSAQCPDGSKGSPCVTCRSGDSTWRMCG